MDDDPMNQNDWQCEACGGQGGHNEGCRGEAALVIENGNLRATIQQLEAQVKELTVVAGRVLKLEEQIREVCGIELNVLSNMGISFVEKAVRWYQQQAKQLEARVKELEEESRQWEKGSLVALLRENKALKALVAQLQGEA